MVKRIEALLDSLAKLNGANDPEREAYQLRNPLLIKSFGAPGKHQTDDKGRRVFDSLLSGYRASLFDLEIKLSGNSRANLRPDDKLDNLLRVYDIRGIASLDIIVNFLRKALRSEDIAKSVPLLFFLEDIRKKDMNNAE